jgi:hypothetical protein
MLNFSTQVIKLLAKKVRFGTFFSEIPHVIHSNKQRERQFVLSEPTIVSQPTHLM